MARGRRTRWLAGGLLGLLFSAQSGSQLSEWAQGPVRWLLRPAEWRELRRAEGPANAVTFVESFWARRDPDPSQPGNAFRETFYKRVEAADLLYSEEKTTGSLTDRGRALILLGPPSSLKIASKSALKWTPRGGRDRNVKVRELPTETWGYRTSVLSPVLRQALADLGEVDAIELVFVSDGGSTTLSAGEEFLQLAARVALARPH